MKTHTAAIDARWLLPLWSSGLLALLVYVSVHEAGAFVYALDDPYIHLALARNIQQGSYGVNVGEWASPSSSILWPFLLSLSPARWIEWAPIAINAVCCVLCVQIVREVLRDTALPPWAQVVGALGVSFGLNLFGLTMTGMEHSLQVLLVMFLAWRMVAQRYDAAFHLALAVAPLVRYETLAITGACAAYLYLTRRDWRACASVGVSLAVMTVFSLTLHRHGLDWLPSSIEAKMAVRSFSDNLRYQPMMVPLLAWLAWVHARQGAWLRYVLLALAPALSFLWFASVGAFGRYEVFLVAWLVILALRMPVPFTLRWAPWIRGLRAHPALPTACLCIVFSVCFTRLWMCTYFVPRACANIAEQQVVMAAVARELGEPVAVNDLGLVALRSGVYVLDLWGLASKAALDARLRGLWTGATVEALMAGKGVEYAFVYREWFPPFPSDFIRVGKLVLRSRRASVSGDEVLLLARNASAARRLHAVLTRMTNRDARLAAMFRIEPPVSPAPAAPPFR